MTSASNLTCPVCGKKSSGSSAGGGCAYCLLELALGPDGSQRTSSSFIAISASEQPTEEVERLVREGVLPRFGDYELLSEIARGGMGIVYRARQKSLNRLVAVKLILAGQLATPESLERFRVEAEAAARLHHPGIVPIYEIGEFETQHFFSMELIDGVSLAECLGEFSLDCKPTSADRRQQQVCIAELIAGVARALDFAHRHGVLHRDLKPSNILIDEAGLPHLTDFGLAKLTGRETSGLTLSHAVLGTPGYLAPEQAAGSLDVTTAADVYGLGATLYELLTGGPPFVGTNAVEAMWKAIHQDPLPPRQVNSAVDRDLDTIALRCLERRPEHRYPSAALVADELERFVRHEPIQARPVRLSERVWRWCQRHPSMALMSAALLLAIFVGSATALWQWRRAELANVSLNDNVEHLQWDLIDDMLRTSQAAKALAKVARLLREEPDDWKAAMFGMSVMEQHRFPVPVLPPIRHPQGAELTVARLSPDGQRIVTASFDGTARLWSTTSGKSLVAPLRHEDSVNWAEFSPDGKQLATCSDDQTVRLWDVASGSALGEPLRHEAGVVRVHFSPDGRFLLSRTARNVTVFDASSGEPVVGPVEHGGLVVAADFRLDGKAFFTAHRAGEHSLVQAWDVSSGRQRLRLETGPLSDADVSSDLTRVITSFGERCIVWDATSGEQLHEVVSTNGRIPSVFFSPDGSTFATIGFDHWARVWDSDSARPLTPELPHYFLLRGACFLGNGERLLTWSDDALAQVWDASTGALFAEPFRHRHRVGHAEIGRIRDREVFLTALSHRKSRAAGVGSGAAQLWKIHDKRALVRRDPQSPWTGHDGNMLSADGKWLAVGMINQTVWVLETATGATVCGPLSVHGAPWGLLFTPDSRRLITTTSRGQVAVWSLPAGKLLFEPAQLPTTFQPLDMTGDGKHFATGSTDGLVRLWDSQTGRPVWQQQHGSEINALDFSPDDRWLATAGEDRITRIWEVSSGKRISELEGHGNEVMRVIFGPDSEHVVTASLDFTARIWEASRGRLKFVLPHQGEVLDAAYSSDGRYVATGSRDRTAALWNARTGRPHHSLLHQQSVRDVRFTSDSERLMTMDFRGVRFWDVESGHPLTVHLEHSIHGGTGYQSISGGPNLTPDGQTVFIATDSSQALLWHCPVPPAQIPGWFPEFLEAVAGQRFVADTNTPELVPADRFLALQERLRASSETDYYTRWARQWLAEL